MQELQNKTLAMFQVRGALRKQQMFGQSQHKGGKERDMVRGTGILVWLEGQWDWLGIDSWIYLWINIVGDYTK